jgi:hypothetical protein
MRTLIAILMIVLPLGMARAQDLEPRAFSPAPVGLNIALLGYAFSQGNVFFDRALLIEDATGEVHGATGAYVRTFGISGMSAKFTTVIPFAWGDWKGAVDGVPASTSRRGFADPRFQLAVNFVGAPAVSLKDFTAYSEGTIVGASLSMIVPIGQYDPTKLINLGSGRWSFRPRVGLSNRLGRWTVETVQEGILDRRHRWAGGWREDHGQRCREGECATEYATWDDPRRSRHRTPQRQILLCQQRKNQAGSRLRPLQHLLSVPMGRRLVI